MVSNGTTWIPAAGSVSPPVESLYVHVPFCAQKCEYCAFYSGPASGDLIQRYVQALLLELELIAQDCRPKTVFFGGGTPSLLTLKQWESVLTTLHRLGLGNAAEFSVECNPATVSADKAALLRQFGVNRISMGVQSLDEALLDRLGRVHSRDMVFRSYDILRKAGFENINIDLMFAIPGQTMEIWNRTLDEALALGTEHLSCYEVIYEEDTPLYEQLKAGECDVDDDLAADLYEVLYDRVGAVGFGAYEVANFARRRRVGESVDRPEAEPGIPAFACRHNVGYWRGRDSYGLGPSASEWVRGLRSRNWSNTVLYCEQLEKGRRAKEFAEALPPLGRAGEMAAFGLRMNAGWPWEEFQGQTGFDLRTEWPTEMAQLVSRGWAERTPTHFRLTRAGLRFADSAAQLFLRPEPARL
ncbi:MAG: Oxygen-independent coproporphyrinogen-III oxidase 1 [Verrucomicrobiota bacterium]|jgi:oxygen-independent coproporphyrinogen-3 oxidase